VNETHEWPVTYVDHDGKSQRVVYDSGADANNSAVTLAIRFGRAEVTGPDGSMCWERHCGGAVKLVDSPPTWGGGKLPSASTASGTSTVVHIHCPDRQLEAFVVGPDDEIIIRMPGATDQDVHNMIKRAEHAGLADRLLVVSGHNVTAVEVVQPK